MARPKIKIDEDQVKKLGMIMCTNKEVAAFFGVSEDTIERRFAGLLKEAREIGKTSLRRFQYLAAEKGNPALLIWLGKQHLGQSDRFEHKQDIIINKNVGSRLDRLKTMLGDKLIT